MRALGLQSISASACRPEGGAVLLPHWPRGFLSYVLTRPATAVDPLSAMPLNRNRIWTTDDDRRLMELHASGRSFISIAATLKRSQAAVEGRLYVLRKREAAAASQAKTGDKWILEIYRSQGSSEHIATVEFASFRLLQVAIVKDRGKKFIVEPPSRVSAADRVTLLDLRAQGFDIALRSVK